MRQYILHCIIWRNTKESEHLTQIPKPHLSTFLSYKYSIDVAQFQHDENFIAPLQSVENEKQLNKILYKVCSRFKKRQQKYTAVRNS